MRLHLAHQVTFGATDPAVEQFRPTSSSLLVILGQMLDYLRDFMIDLDLSGIGRTLQAHHFHVAHSLFFFRLLFHRSTLDNSTHAILLNHLSLRVRYHWVVILHDNSFVYRTSVMANIVFRAV